MTGMHWGRKLVIALGVAFLMSGAWCLYEGWRGKQRFNEWQMTELVRLSLNLGEPGRHVATYFQSFSSPHGVVLELETGMTNTEQVLTNLSGVILIRDLRGGEVRREDFTNNDIGWSLLVGQHRKPALRLGHIPTGQYMMEVTIANGASGLTTTNHTIVGRYMLCGLEKMPAVIMSIVGWMLLFLATICAVITHRYLRRRKQMA